MKNAYIRLTERLDLDIRAACDFGPANDVQFGPRSIPHLKWPNATVVMDPLPRVPAGARSLDLTFRFTIEVQLPKAMANEAECELLKIDYADRLTQRLAPFVETDALPQPFPGVPPYAGVGWKPQVERFDPGHDADSNGGWAFRLRFSCNATVHQ